MPPLRWVCGQNVKLTKVDVMRERNECGGLTKILIDSKDREEVRYPPIPGIYRQRETPVPPKVISSERSREKGNVKVCMSTRQVALRRFRQLIVQKQGPPQPPACNMTGPLVPTPERSPPGPGPGSILPGYWSVAEITIMRPA